MKICFSTLACPDWDWHRVLKYGTQFGFDGAEVRLLSRETDLLNIPELQPASWSQRRRELADTGFRIAGLASSVHFDDLHAQMRAQQVEIGRRYVDLCAALGGEFIRVFGDILPPANNQDRPTVIRRIADDLVTLAEYGASAGIQILLETHGDFSASSPCVEVMQLASHPFVGLVWDTHHPWRFHSESLTETWSQLRPWTRHTHWKDSVTLAERSSTAQAATAASVASQLMAGHQHADYVLFGGGEFPAQECLELLFGSGYSGWYSLEWEKMWHPELMSPEIVLPLFPGKLRQLASFAQRAASI